MRDATDKVTAAIVAKIEPGEWDDGCRVPPEHALAAEHGMARNTLRQALDRLQERRLIVRQGGRIQL